MLTDETGRALRRANEASDDTVRLDFTAPKAGAYCLAVRDAAREGGPACAYRLEVLDRAVAIVVEHQEDDPEAVLDRGRQLVDREEEAAVADDGHDLPARVAERRRDARRDAEAHRAGCEPEQPPPAGAAEVPVHPRREVAGVDRDDRVVRREPVERGDDGAEDDPVVGEVLPPRRLLGLHRVQPRDPGAAALRRRQPDERLEEGDRVAGERDVRLVREAEARRVGVDVDERLRGRRRGREAVPLCRHVVEARPHREDEVGLCEELRPLPPRRHSQDDVPRADKNTHPTIDRSHRIRSRGSRRLFVPDR